MLISPHNHLQLVMDSQYTQWFRDGRSERGFTLIEIMIVVLVIGILVAVAIPTFRVYRDKSSVAAAMSTASAIQASLSAYASTSANNLYPSAIADYNELIAITNTNGAKLKSTELRMGIEFRNYSTFDLSGDGQYDAYSMSFNVIDVDPQLAGWCIILTVNGTEKCPGL